MKNKVLNNQGQTIIELMMALSVFILGFLGVINLLTNSLGYNRIVTDTNTATYLAGEGIELVRNAIDNNLQKNVLWRNGMPVGSYEIDFLDLSSPDNTNDTGGWCHYFRTFNAGSLDKLLYDENTNTYSYQNGIVTPFTREIIIDYYSVRDDGVVVQNIGTDTPKEDISGRALLDDIMVVHSIVRWNSSGGRREEVDLEDHFYNWQSSDALKSC